MDKGWIVSQNCKDMGRIDSKVWWVFKDWMDILAQLLLALQVT